MSIVLAVFDGASFIAQAIESVRGQTFSDWELLVVDDGSTDKTVEVVERLRAIDQRIRLIRLEENVGVAKARQAGLDNVRGDWVTFLDADDLYAPRRLERLVAPEPVARPSFHCRQSVFDADGSRATLANSPTIA